MTHSSVRVGLPFLIGFTVFAAPIAQATDCPNNLTGAAALSCVLNANTEADAALDKVETHLPRSEARQAADAAYTAYRDAECRYESIAFLPPAATPSGSPAAAGPRRRSSSAACRRAMPHNQPPAAPHGR